MKLEIKPLPYKNYIWCSDVDEEIRAERFKLLYDIDNVRIEQVSSNKKIIQNNTKQKRQR